MITVEICDISNTYGMSMPYKVRSYRQRLFEWKKNYPNCNFSTSEGSRYIIFETEKDYIYFALVYPYYFKQVFSPSSNG